MGGLVCQYTLETIKGAGTSRGDTMATRDSPIGRQRFAIGCARWLNQITGGTGKFTGIQGQAPFQCRFLNDKGQVTCAQQFEYRLTSETTGTSTSPTTTGTTK
jgi:hypothetical protein